MDMNDKIDAILMHLLSLEVVSRRLELEGNDNLLTKTLRENYKVLIHYYNGDNSTFILPFFFKVFETHILQRFLLFFPPLPPVDSRVLALGQKPFFYSWQRITGAC